MCKLVLTMALLVATATSANAAVISAAGIFGSDAPKAGYSAPRAAWNFNFQTSDLPLVQSSTLDGFTIAVDTLVYTLSGASAGAPGFTATFNTTAAGGGFDIASADGTFQAFFFGPQLFFGPLSGPTFLQSDYVPSIGHFVSNGVTFGASDIGNSEERVFAGIVEAPEPAAFALFGMGLAGIALRRRANA